MKGRRPLIPPPFEDDPARIAILDVKSYQTHKHHLHWVYYIPKQGMAFEC